MNLASVKKPIIQFLLDCNFVSRTKKNEIKFHHDRKAPEDNPQWHKSTSNKRIISMFWWFTIWMARLALINFSDWDLTFHQLHSLKLLVSSSSNIIKCWPCVLRLVFETIFTADDCKITSKDLQQSSCLNITKGWYEKF